MIPEIYKQNYDVLSSSEAPTTRNVEILITIFQVVVSLSIRNFQTGLDLEIVQTIFRSEFPSTKTLQLFHRLSIYILNL
jgi:hypothetical protein